MRIPIPHHRIRLATVLSAILALTIAATFNGCVSATTGNPIDQSKFTQIQKGVTTKTQMEAMFGPPTNISLTTDGSGRQMETWVHSHTDAQATTESYIPIWGLFSNGAHATTQTEQLQAIYNSADIVNDYHFSDTASNTDAHGWLGGSNVVTTTAPTTR